MSQPPNLTACGKIAYDKDKDRFLAAMTAPDLARESLFALLAFNHEIAKTRESVSEIMLGQIRLQWWREAISECFEGMPRRHEVVQPLYDAIQNHGLSREILDRMIDAREQDIGEEDFAKLEDLQAYADATGGLLNEAMAEILGVHGETDRETARLVGTAWALTGMMRAFPFSLRQRRIMMSADLLRKYDINRQDLIELRNPDNLKPAVEEICQAARHLLAQARANRKSVSKSILPVLHLAGLADGYLKQLEKAGYDTFSPIMAQPPALRSLGLILRHLFRRY